MNRTVCTPNTRWMPAGEAPATPPAARVLRLFREPVAGGPVVVWFPYAGGTASHVADWHHRLPAGVGLAAVQYPGRAERLGDRRPDSLVELADQVADAIEELRLGARAVLWGHSLGALVALETTRRLERRGAAPRALVVTGRRAPGRPGAFDHLADLDDDALVDALVAMEPTSSAPVVHGEARDYALSLVRADARLAAAALAGEGSTPTQPVAVPILAASGDRDPAAAVGDLTEWTAFSTATVTVASLVGGHLGAVATPDQVVALLRETGLLETDLVETDLLDGAGTTGDPARHARPSAPSGDLRRDGDHA